MSEGQPPVPPAPPGGVPAPGVPPAAEVGPGGTAPLTGGVLSSPPVAAVPAPAPEVPPLTAAVPAPAPEVPPLTAAVPAPAAAIPAPAPAAPLTEGALVSAAGENETLTEPEQPFFSVMLLDGQPIEFPVEMAGFEQDLGNGPVILQPNGCGVETSTHKFIAFDSGETALYDLASDPDGLNNIATDPAQSALVQEMSAKLTDFPTAVPALNPAGETTPAPMEAIPVSSTPDIPKVTVPAPNSAAAVEPQPVAATPPTPLPAKPVGILPPPLPKPSEIKLPEPGLPPGVGDFDEGEESVSAVLPPPNPSVKSPADIELPKPGLPKPSEVPELKTLETPVIPAPLPSPEKDDSADLKKDLLEAFDTDGDGTINEDEKPSEAQLKKFTTRRREKGKVDPVDTKRKSRMEAETAVKAAMRELEEARMREEMSVLEELEAHKSTRDKAKRGCDQCDEEIEKLKQTDRARSEKSEATIAKLKQEYDHDEDLIRHSVRTKKAARLDDEDRISELDDGLASLHEENDTRLRKEEEEDRLRKEERRMAQERYVERVQTDEQEKTEYEADLRKQEEGEKELKQELQAKELQMQERLRLIKFEEDDNHSRIEHEVEVLEKSREKLLAMENIEEQEIRDLSAKVDARRIAIANEKKVERRMAVAEHEADLLNQVRGEEEPIAIAKPAIDRDHIQVPDPDMEPTLSKKSEPKMALPVSSQPEIKEALPVAAQSKPSTPNLSKSQDEDYEEKDVLPAIIKPGSKPVLSVVPEEGEKPAFPLTASTKPAGDLPQLPEVPQSDSGDSGKQREASGFLKKLFGDKKKVAPKSATEGPSSLPQPKTEGPKPDLPPLPAALTPAKTSADIPELPPLPGATAVPAELPPLSDQPLAKPAPPEEMERKTLERKLGRIADERAERMNEPAPIEPTVPSLPKNNPAGDLPAFPSMPGGSKPIVPAPLKPAALPTPGAASGGFPLPSAGGDKPALPPLPKPADPSGGGLPPLPSPGGDKPALPTPGTASGGFPLPSAGGDKPALPPLPKPGDAPSLPKPAGPAGGGLPPLPSPGGDKPALPPSLPKPGDAPSLPKPAGPAAGGLPPLPPLPGKDK